VLDIPWIGQWHSFFSGEADASGPAYFQHLEGTLPARGELMKPFSVQDSPQDKVPSPELPTMRKPFMIASEHLVVPCISDRCLPPSLVNEVHVIAPLLFLQRFIKSLDSRRAQVDFRGKAGFSPVDQEERGLPSSSAGCGPVAPQYAQKLLNPPCTVLL